MSKHFEVYVMGIVHASVCTGISSRWRLSKDRAFISGEPHPSQCERDPARTHWLFSC